MEALSKKGTPAPARTGTGAGTARERPSATRLPGYSLISTPYQRHLIRGQLLSG